MIKWPRYLFSSDIRKRHKELLKKVKILRRDRETILHNACEVIDDYNRLKKTYTEMRDELYTLRAEVKIYRKHFNEPDSL
jgi:hypothetical protein